MRTFKFIVIICVVLILLATLGLFIFVKTFDTARFKDQLSSQLSAQLNRKVDMGKLDFSFSIFQGMFISVEEFRVRDDPKFSNDALLHVAEIKLDIDIMAFLIQKKVIVSSIAVTSPEINLTRLENGLLNTQELGPKQKALSAGKENDSPVSADKKEIPHLPQLLVQAIRLEKGKLAFVDKAQDPPVKVQLNDIGLNVVNLSSVSPFKFTMGSSVLSEEHNLEIKGQGQLDLKTLQVRLDNVNINLDFSKLEVSELEKIAPTLKLSELGLKVDGKMDAEISQIVAGPEGLLLLAATGKVADANINLPTIPLVITGGMDFDISEKDIQLENIAFAVGKGSLTGQVRIDEYMKQQRYFCNLDFKDLPLRKSLDEFGPQANFHGKSDGLVKLNGEGFQSDKLLPGLNGESQFHIKEGIIENFNILKFILSKMTMLPQLDQALIKNLPLEYKKQLEQSQTVFDQIDIRTTVKKGNTLLDQAEFLSPVFSLSAKGEIDLTQNIQLTAVLRIPKDLAAQMTAIVPELKVLQEEDGRLSIPVKAYSGPVSGFRIFPDTEALARKIIMRKGSGELEGLLNKVLGSEQTPPEGQPEEQKPADGQPSEKSVTDILDSILK